MWKHDMFCCWNCQWAHTHSMWNYMYKKSAPTPRTGDLSSTGSYQTWCVFWLPAEHTTPQRQQIINGIHYNKKVTYSPTMMTDIPPANSLVWGLPRSNNYNPRHYSEQSTAGITSMAVSLFCMNIAFLNVQSSIADSLWIHYHPSPTPLAVPLGSSSVK